MGRGNNMEVHNIKEKPVPIGRRILTYVSNTEKPGWEIDCFVQSGVSDHHIPNGANYLHNISHWAELPDVPGEAK